MILILSERQDISTDYVIEYLNKSKKEFIRINEDTIFKILEVEVTNNLPTEICFSVDVAKPNLPK